MSKSEKDHQNHQNTEKAKVQESSGLEVVSIGYGEGSSGEKQASWSQDKLDQVADHVNAVIDQNKLKWETEQDWNDSSWKVWLD